MSILSVLTILSFSTFAATFAYAAPLANTAKDWQYVNGNSWGMNYSPETQITKDNVGQLEVKWLFPLEGKASASLTLPGVTLNEGSTTPPIVAGGKVFVTTNYLRTYAIDAKTGKQAWAHNYAINATDAQSRLPLIFGSSLQQHLHGIRYWEAGNAVLVSGMACDFYGVDAATGKTSFWVKDLCKDIPGNLYKYRQGAVSQTNIGTYEKGKQFIFVLPGAMHSNTYAGDFRHTTIGVDMNTKQIVWKLFSFPPQDKATKDWALQECSIGYFSNIPCSEVASKAPGNLEWDWAQPDQPPNIYGGVTANWGQIVVDEDTGIIYTQTGNQGPYTYVGTTPGPRLYGSAIMAIDSATGKRVWWLQPFPRDPYDYDCNWSGVLADVPTLGKVYMKGCKEGRLNIINAQTGKPVNIIDVVNEQVGWGQVTSAALKEPYQGGVRYHFNDVYSTYDMREMVSPDGSKYCGRPCDVYPNFSNGIFGTDMSYDPQTGTLFHYAIGLQTTIVNSPAPVVDKSVSITKGYPITNTSIVARDAATGKVKWSWFWSVGQQRSHLVVTPTLVFTGFIDGYMRFFDKNTGKLIHEMNLGSDMRVGVTTGQDSSGNQMIFTVLGITSTGRITPTNPGIVVALGLSGKAAATGQTTTVTTTATTTQSTTLTSTSVSTTTSATTVTSTSATTLTTTSATTATVTASTTVATTVTTTAPAKTVTSSVTETTGLPSEVTYAAIGVAVIAIIAAAVLVMRKK
ncbi:MAG: PQQ-binding-like beta-propeller repeat protein [Thaumarchaeota archaeon]|nr:PQQ-binding-like beta-propeller repeat protein [Nitrososphaerota archaeon]MCL5318222.1 PQQ-binding-like beta-propeller repeat protein [Nitrososphaerota archaeon]